MEAEREEAKAVLTLFLKKQGLNNAIAARTINRSGAFVDHLVSRLHSRHKNPYLVGRELTAVEIRDALVPYLESLHNEYPAILVHMVENFPEQTTSIPPSMEASNSKKLKALARISGKLPSHIAYLLELGMELETIREVTRKFPAFAYYSLDGKIKPLVEFLLHLGIPKQDIPSILTKRPQLCGISLTENLIPTMEFLEELGFDKRQWAKVIHRSPALLTYSRHKLRSTVDFIFEMGLSPENVGRVLTRCPNIISYSVEDKLRPTAQYFQSLDVNIAFLLQKSPQTFGLSIEGNLKPITNFFLDRGYSLGDVAAMVSRYGMLYSFSLPDNLIPKWEYFLTMVYLKPELVKFPQYFGYSLEGRIKPRYETVRRCGVDVLLNQMLSLSQVDFQKLLEKKMQKMAKG